MNTTAIFNNFTVTIIEFNDKFAVKYSNVSDKFNNYIRGRTHTGYIVIRREYVDDYMVWSDNYPALHEFNGALDIALPGKIESEDDTETTSVNKKYLPLFIRALKDADKAIDSAKFDLKEIF